MVCGSNNCPASFGFDSMIDCCYVKCHKPEWAGDNICDDYNNFESCDWDGGDCCGDHTINTEFCTFCECLDPNCIHQWKIHTILYSKFESKILYPFNRYFVKVLWLWNSL